jgi:hypothetical protein
MALNPMSTFDPARRCRIHDLLNDEMVEWSPELAASYRKSAFEEQAGIMSFDGMLLDGWTESEEATSSARPRR